jgi:hypothetical protein
VSVLLGLDMKKVMQNASRLTDLMCVTMLSVLVGAVALSAIFILHLRWNLSVMSHKTYVMHIRLIVFIVVQVHTYQGGGVPEFRFF